MPETSNPAPAPSPGFLSRALIAACLVLLLATAVLLSHLSTQRAELAAQAARASLAELETRGLRQQLEAERLLAAGQSRLLREALGGTSPASPIPAAQSATAPSATDSSRSVSTP